MGNQSTKQTDTSQTTSTQQNPWAPAIPQLQGTALPGLQTALNQSQAGNAATQPTNFLAGLTPDQIANFQSMITQSAQNTPGVSSLISGGNNSFNQGTAGAQTALGSLLGFNPSQYLDPASLISAANNYTAGANIPAQVAAATQGGLEQARDVLIPGTESAAAGTGNTNSSRTGVAEGIIGRGLAEQAQNLSGALSGQTFSNSLNTALSGGQAQNQDLLTALGGALSGGTGLGALGTSTVGQGVDSLASILGLGATGGAGQQTGNQTTLSNQLAQNQYATQNPFASLSQYLPYLTAIAGLGGQSYGQSQGSTTETTTPSALATIGSLLSAGGSLLGGSGPMGATGLGGVSGVSSLIGQLMGRK